MSYGAFESRHPEVFKTCKNNKFEKGTAELHSLKDRPSSDFAPKHDKWKGTAKEQIRESKKPCNFGEGRMTLLFNGALRQRAMVPCAKGLMCSNPVAPTAKLKV